MGAKNKADVAPSVPTFRIVLNFFRDIFQADVAPSVPTFRIVLNFFS